MVVLGIILVLLAAGMIFVAVLSSANTPATVEFGGISVTMEPLWVFLTGALTVLLLVLGIELVRAGTRRAAKRRKEKKELNRLANQLEARESERQKAASEPSTRASSARDADSRAASSARDADSRATSSAPDSDTRATRTDGDVTDPNRPPQ